MISIISSHNDKEKRLEHSLFNQANKGSTIPIEFSQIITHLKQSDDFEGVYSFFEQLSSQGNQKGMLIACEEGLWKRLCRKKIYFLAQGMYYMKHVIEEISC